MGYFGNFQINGPDSYPIILKKCNSFFSSFSKFFHFLFLNFLIIFYSVFEIEYQYQLHGYESGHLKQSLTLLYSLKRTLDYSTYCLSFPLCLTPDLDQIFLHLFILHHNHHLRRRLCLFLRSLISISNDWTYRDHVWAWVLVDCYIMARSWKTAGTRYWLAGEEGFDVKGLDLCFFYSIYIWYQDRYFYFMI